MPHRNPAGDYYTISTHPNDEGAGGWEGGCFGIDFYAKFVYDDVQTFMLWDIRCKLWQCLILYARCFFFVTCCFMSRKYS